MPRSLESLAARRARNRIEWARHRRDSAHTETEKLAAVYDCLKAVLAELPEERADAVRAEIRSVLETHLARLAPPLKD
ncbi:hypothetical protein [Actinomadura terrae]|uniref:hypothetical protein n=1 Tax=Actinomadura terrae TaxID=604353 RepID=UPI001FA71998|nr:hypothetical protein [Actinomadura terrae]